MLRNQELIDGIAELKRQREQEAEFSDFQWAVIEALIQFFEERSNHAH